MVMLIDEKSTSRFYLTTGEAGDFYCFDAGYPYGVDECANTKERAIMKIIYGKSNTPQAFMDDIIVHS